MNYWCSLYGCWIKDVEDIIETEQLIKDGCDPDIKRKCSGCCYVEEVGLGELFD